MALIIHANLGVIVYAKSIVSGVDALPPKMSTQQRRATRTRFLLALRQLDEAWVAAFHQVGLSDIYFSRLFTELWLCEAGALPKTDAYALVQGVSAQTATKYVKRAISEGYLQETANPADGRSRLLRMSPLLRARFTQVIDRASEAFVRVFLRREAPGL
jgi:hypothetical protein